MIFSTGTYLDLYRFYVCLQWSIEMTLNKTLIGAVMGAGVLAFTMASASAAIVCSGNVCWHVKDKYEYPPEGRVTLHDDNWKWGPSDKYEYREHEGRGYWREDKWITW
jgi:hypothetical protein